MNIADLRQEYMRAGLAEADAHADPLVQFERWFKDALAAQLPLANAMTLATVAAGGAPDARIVLLKGVENGGFVFYTNYESRKGRQLAARPQACLVFFWAPLERQVRIDGARGESLRSGIRRVFRDPACRRAPVGARLGAERRGSRQEMLLNVKCGNKQRQYGDNPPRPPHWGGYRVIPSRMEFWQGRENRLHDRLLYPRDGGGWKIERLAP